MRYLVIAVLLAGALPCQAQSQQWQRCAARAKTQLALNMCAGEEAARAEATLKDIYDKVVSAESDPDAVAKIQTAQEAWLAYRNAFIEATYPATNKQAEYGSIYPMSFALLRAALTQRQVAALRELFKEHTGPARAAVPRLPAVPKN